MMFHCIVNQHRERVRIFTGESTLTVTFDMLHNDEHIRRTYRTMSRHIDNGEPSLRRQWSRDYNSASIVDYDCLVAAVQAYGARNVSFSPDNLPEEWTDRINNSRVARALIQPRGASAVSKGSVLA